MNNFALVAVAAATVACGGTDSPPSPASPPVTSVAPVRRDPKDAPDGLDVRLSNGKQLAPPYDRANIGFAGKLPDADAQALLARSKPIAVDPADQQSFVLRPGSQPPPRTGETVASSF